MPIENGPAPIVNKHQPEIRKTQDVCPELKVDTNNLLDSNIADFKFEGEGKMEFKLGNTDVKFKYSSPDLKYLLKIIFNNAGFSPSISKLEILRNLKKVDDLTMENSTGKYSTKDILGEDWTVFFWINKPTEIKSGDSINMSKKNILMETNPLTPRGMLMLGHEIGHFEEEQSLSEEEKNLREAARMKFNLRSINNETGGIVINEERNAWARALNHFRHFSNDIKIENQDIEKVVHHDCLQRYEEFVEKFKS